ncbi:MAG: hypothetical protein AAGG01_06300 [Planctomycetota bacterium]
MVPHDQPGAQVALVNVRTGALVDGNFLDVRATGVPTPGSSALTDVERVSDEIWVTASFWVYRYEARGERRYLGSFSVDAPIRSLEFQDLEPAGRVLITTTDSILVYDVEARERGHMPVAGAGDTLLLERTSMLVAIQDESRVDRYTLEGQRLGTFAGPTVPTALGLLSEPRQLARRLSGNILVCGDVRVYEFTPSGDFVGEYDVGPFEGGVYESISGRLFVPLQNSVALYDAQTQRSTQVGGLFFGQGRRVGFYDSGTRLVLEQGDWMSDVSCRGAVHSGGERARAGLLGSPDLDEASIAVFVDRMPPRSLVRLSFSPSLAFTPAGSAGYLCLGASGLATLPTPERGDATGQALFQIVRGPTTFFDLGAGSTWNTQALYRDGHALRYSSAITFTLKP